MGLVAKSFVYVCGRALPALIGVGGVAVYTRLLDPASVGLYALLLSFTLFVSAVGFSWLRVAALRLAAGSDDAYHARLLTSVGISFVGTSALVGLVEAAVLRGIHPELGLTTVALTIAAAASSAWFELNGTMLQARLSVVAWGTLNFARAAGALVISVVLIARGLKTDALLAGFVLGNCTTVVWMRIWQPGLRGRFEWSIFKRLYLLGWPASVNAAFTALSPTLQRYLLDFVAGGSALGLYSVASDFSAQTLASIIGAISLAGIPLAYKAQDQGGAGALRMQLLDNARLIFGVALPATVGLMVLAKPISHVVFGARFVAGANVIITVIAVSAFMAGLRVYYFEQAFELALQTRPQAVIASIGTLCVAGLSIILTPRFAALGAAVSSLVAGGVWLALSIAWGRRVLPMPIPTRSWLKTLFATAGMAVALELLPAREDAPGLLSAIALGGLTYALLSIALRFELVRSRFTNRFAWLQRS